MIPKIIYQTWKTKEPNDSIDKLRNTWINKNPEFEYEYYDDNDIKKFIETHFDERVNKCYGRILNGSLKADFFRYCVMYIKGGLYIDIDISCEKPLTSMFNFDEIHLITTTDNCRNNKNDRIYQAFLGGEANSAVFMNAINHICTCIETQKYKTNMFELSGPTIFSKLLKQYMNEGITNENEKCKFLKELTFVNPVNKKKFVIPQHNIPKEKLESKNVIFATAQHKIDRKSNPHYMKQKSQFKKGYYT